MRWAGTFWLSVCGFLARPMFLLLGSLMLLLLANPAAARITNIVIQTCTSPAFGGTLFGNVKHYEQLTGGCLRGSGSKM